MKNWLSKKSCNQNRINKMQLSYLHLGIEDASSVLSKMLKKRAPNLAPVLVNYSYLSRFLRNISTTADRIRTPSSAMAIQSWGRSGSIGISFKASCLRNPEACQRFRVFYCLGQRQDGMPRQCYLEDFQVRSFLRFVGVSVLQVVSKKKINPAFSVSNTFIKPAMSLLNALNHGA